MLSSGTPPSCTPVAVQPAGGIFRPLVAAEDCLPVRRRDGPACRRSPAIDRGGELGSGLPVAASGPASCRSRPTPRQTEPRDGPKKDRQARPPEDPLAPRPSTAIVVLDFLTGMTLTTINGLTYHPQELAFFSWFFDQVPSLGLDGLYSWGGTFKSPASPCR